MSPSRKPASRSRIASRISRRPVTLATLVIAPTYNARVNDDELASWLSGADEDMRETLGRVVDTEAGLARVKERVWWYGLDDKPIDVFEAGKLLSDIGKRRVALTVVSRRPSVGVSTVFLVLDHGMFGGVELWETTVFGGPADGHGNRYASRAEARNGHRVVVAYVQQELAEIAERRRRVSRVHASYRARWA